MSIRCRYISFLVMLIGLIAWGSSSAFAQEKNLVQFSGLILSADSENGVPYVNIRNDSFRGELYMANHQGYFSFVAHEGDTLTFSSVGYHSMVYVVGKAVDKKVTAHIRMKSKVVELEMVQPYPYASVEEFNQAFLALEIADDNEMIAKKNLSPESLAAMARVTPMNGQEMRGINVNQQHFRMANKTVNERMANPLLNPFAWGNLIRQISEGNWSRSKNNW